MTTTAFKNLRAFVQISCIAVILLSIPPLLYLVIENYFFALEAGLDMGMLSLSYVFKTTALVNITMAFFASCCVNSKVKVYMKVYLFTSFFHNAFLAATFLFIYKTYKNRFNRIFSSKTAINIALKTEVETYFICSTRDNSCMRIFKEKIDALIFVYCICTGIILLLNLVIFVLAKIATRIEIQKKGVPLPKMQVKKNVGMNTASLRNKRVIEVTSNNM